jgi:hypothetical protein
MFQRNFRYCVYLGGIIDYYDLPLVGRRRQTASVAIVREGFIAIFIVGHGFLMLLIMSMHEFLIMRFA